MSEASHNLPDDSDQFDADSFPTEGANASAPQGAPSPGASGNRPAQGARHVSADEMLTDGFQGSENAGDFLGLDLEFTGAMDATQEQEQEQAPALDLPSPVSVAPAQPESTDYDAEFELDGPTQIMHADEEVFGDEDDFSDDEFDDEYDEELDGTLQTHAPAGRGKLILVTIAAGAIAFGAVFTGPKLYNKYMGGSASSTQVAKVPTPTKTTPKVTKAQPPTTVPANPVVSKGGSVPSVAATTAEGSKLPETGAGALPEPTVTEVNDGRRPDVVVANQVTEPFKPSPLDELVGNESEGAPGGVVDAEVAASVGMASAGAFPTFDAGYEWVSPDLLDMVWRGTEVPMEAIAAPARTLMPRVGHVRVHMSSGQTIDGRLVAVGQRRVWIDMRPGRVGLDGDTVERFEHLAVESSFDGPLAETRRAPITGRVSVVVPGGLLFGRILARDGDMTTLLCDDQSEITIRNAVVTSVAQNRAVLVQR